ncbi:MAG: contractile injection system protein, VgrG/Pvc8 family [Armatimonadota bacterium]|nr:contractile injection system protein, VgrG/Pvc8 family [Armatimonadota bacterium]
MAASFQVILDGSPANDLFYEAMTSIEVEENADLPGAIQLSLPVNRSVDGELTFVSDDRLRPLAGLAVMATAENGSSQCIFDGVVLSHKVHLETGATNSTVQVWGQDASWMMNLEEKVREWVDTTDGAVADAIFGDYGITPSPENQSDDSPSHTEDGHSLMQRGSDIQFLRTLARRNGKLCRVVCRNIPGQRIGYFARPALDKEPVVTLILNDPDKWTVSALDFEWDVMRPSAVAARQALFNDDTPEGAGVSVNDSGLPLLDERGLSDFAGSDMSVLLTAPVDDVGELNMRAESLLREAGWFARCEGEADVSRLKVVLRVGDIVALDGVGSLLSGKYLVWSVRHTIDGQAHKMKFALVRNAVGPKASGAGPLGGLL